MSKRKIFMATGTLILAIVAFFASQANKKWTSVTNAWYKTNLGSNVTLFHGLNPANVGLQTIAIPGKTVFIRIGVSGLVRTLTTTAGGAKTIYSKH